MNIKKKTSKTTPLFLYIGNVLLHPAVLLSILVIVICIPSFLHAENTLMEYKISYIKGGSVAVAPHHSVEIPKEDVVSTVIATNIDPDPIRVASIERN